MGVSVISVPTEITEHEGSFVKDYKRRVYKDPGVADSITIAAEADREPGCRAGLSALSLRQENAGRQVVCVKPVRSALGRNVRSRQESPNLRNEPDGSRDWLGRVVRRGAGPRRNRAPGHATYHREKPRALRRVCRPAHRPWGAGAK